MKQPPFFRTARAFTLIELLVVIAIIAILAGLIFPLTQTIAIRSQSIGCTSNLRQLWMAINAAATDNGNKYPPIKINPDDDSAEEGAKELWETLKPYGITDKALQCPADMKRKPLSWFAQVHTSFMWQPPAEDETLQNVRIVTPRRTFTAKPSRVALLTDYEAIHEPDTAGTRMRMNVIYVDGHVGSR